MRELTSRGFLAETSNQTSWIERYIVPEDRARVQAAIANAIRSKGLFEVEHRVVRADGSTGWTLSRAVPVIDEYGEITEWFGAATDVTARRRTARARVLAGRHPLRHRPARDERIRSGARASRGQAAGEGGSSSRSLDMDQVGTLVMTDEPPARRPTRGRSLRASGRRITSGGPRAIQVRGGKTKR